MLWIGLAAVSGVDVGRDRVCVGRHTVCRLLRIAGALAEGHWSSYHRGLSKRRWSTWRLARTLAQHVVDRFVPSGTIAIVGDDTVTQHPGKHVYGKGYDAKAVRQAAQRRGYVVHIPRKGEDAQRPHRRHARARRWVVERLHSWTNRARRLLVRWEKKADNFLAFVHLQFALIAWRTAGVIG